MNIPLQAYKPGRYRTGVEVSEGYNIVIAAIRDGHKVYIDLSRFNKQTVTARIYGSCRERFFVKIYAANENQAMATLEELTIMSGGQIPPHQMELDL